MSVYLKAIGIACSLGRGKGEVANALFQKDPGMPASTCTLLSQKSVPVGKVPFDLPELPSELTVYNSRNNRLLRVALDEIKSVIDDAIAKYGASRVGVIMATSTSGMLEEEKAFVHNYHTGSFPNQYNHLQSEISSPSLFASLYIAAQGPSYTISTACSSAGKAMCSAKRLISAGICDAVVIGGVDTLCDLTLNGFDSLGLISKQVCNPFSKNRDGITIGEGAAVFLATRDGTSADIELSGCGESSDAYHISSPEPNGVGVETAINEALKQAGLKPTEISYINLHGTGTPLNDSMESACINRIFGDKLPCSSTKGLTGHTLGASGAIEAAFLWLALSLEENGKIPLPPHVWDGETDGSIPQIHLTGYGEYVLPINGAYALMSNSFAFGGSNVSIILKKQAQINCNIVDLLPHDPPMVLIDRLVDCRNDFVHCEVVIKENSPFCENGSVPSFVAIEYMAQTIAVWNGYMSKRQGESPKIGYLLGTRHLELNIPSFKIGDVLNVYGTPEYIDTEIASFDCWVDLNGSRVVHAGLKVFQPNHIHLSQGQNHGK